MAYTTPDEYRVQLEKSNSTQDKREIFEDMFSTTMTQKEWDVFCEFADKPTHLSFWCHYTSNEVVFYPHNQDCKRALDWILSEGEFSRTEWIRLLPRILNQMASNDSNYRISEVRNRLNKNNDMEYAPRIDSSFGYKRIAKWCKQYLQLDEYNIENVINDFPKIVNYTDIGRYIEENKYHPIFGEAINGLTRIDYIEDNIESVNNQIISSLTDSYYSYIPEFYLSNELSSALNEVRYEEEIDIGKRVDFRFEDDYVYNLEVKCISVPISGFYDTPDANRRGKELSTNQKAHSIGNDQIDEFKILEKYKNKFGDSIERNNPTYIVAKPWTFVNERDIKSLLRDCDLQSIDNTPMSLKSWEKKNLHKYMNGIVVLESPVSNKDGYNMYGKVYQNPHNKKIEPSENLSDLLNMEIEFTDTR